MSLSELSMACIFHPSLTSILSKKGDLLYKMSLMPKEDSSAQSEENTLKNSFLISHKPLESVICNTDNFLDVFQWLKLQSFSLWFLVYSLQRQFYCKFYCK